LLVWRERCVFILKSDSDSDDPARAANLDVRWQRA
jgi:hypothetical protein